ncbi:MAG: helix-turn-helix transcriptional regulator [Eubacteriaceae bacterium]
MSKLGDNLRKRRKELNLTLEEVANEAGITLSTYQRYEKGIIKNISSDKLEKLAVFLQTTPELLIGWDNITEIYRIKLNKILANPSLEKLFEASENFTPKDIEFLTNLFIHFQERKNNQE